MKNLFLILLIGLGSTKLIVAQEERALESESLEQLDIDFAADHWQEWHSRWGVGIQAAQEQQYRYQTDSLGSQAYGSTQTGLNLHLQWRKSHLSAFELNAAMTFAQQVGQSDLKQWLLLFDLLWAPAIYLGSWQWEGLLGTGVWGRYLYFSDPGTTSDGFYRAERSVFSQQQGFIVGSRLSLPLARSFSLALELKAHWLDLLDDEKPSARAQQAILMLHRPW